MPNPKTRAHLPLQLTTMRHQSPLGGWQHTECVPLHLSHVVSRIWHFEGRVTLLRERHCARAFSEIILHLGPRFRDVKSSGETGELFPLACASGLATRPFVIEGPNEICRVMGIQLHPEGAWQLMQLPASELVDATVHSDDALGKHVASLTEACSAADDARTAIELVCAWISSRLPKHEPAHSAIRYTAQELRASKGTATISALQNATSLSKPKFVSMFREQVGATPKQYGRMLRFQHATELLRANRPLSDTALSAGYYDQSHMYRDFSQFACMTPAEYASANAVPGATSLME